MAKIIISLIFILICNLEARKSFEQACVECHTTNVPDLATLYFRYLQTYGSTRRVHDAMSAYLSAPDINNSILPPQVVKGFGLHSPISPHELEYYLNIYLEQYDVKKRIKLKHN
ncbi:MAG: hypothetical protein M0P91_03480 [Sulfuricurvum sp.]|uniref:c-type cytochrome n=1 Tax=Sulfuricurvum sp. TaxID=2025608 RepID=UPI0025E0B171|nr:hypothetical protein [Sulfuricurvum sp.]MCK9372231.1 hypothetical protein [Sulfuricurvum sp.]